MAQVAEAFEPVRQATLRTPCDTKYADCRLSRRRHMRVLNPNSFSLFLPYIFRCDTHCHGTVFNEVGAQPSALAIHSVTR